MVFPFVARGPKAAWLDLSLQCKGLVVIAVPCVLLVSGVFALYSLNRAARQVRLSVDHTSLVRLQTEWTKSLLLEVENTVRGRLMTTRGDQRHTYDRGRVDLVNATTTLSLLLKDDADQQSRVRSKDSSRTFTALYVEDNEANVTLMRRVIALRPSVKLVVAGDGRRGVEMVQQHRPDLILLDLHLPDQHGSLIIGQLRANPDTIDTPIVIISADAMPNQIERALLAGASAFLPKPLDLHQFLTTVDTLLDGTSAAV